MAMVEPVELSDPAELDPVHFIAIGGSGMNGIASMFLELGNTVSGSDRADSKYLRALESRGARVYVGHAAEQLGDARAVVASSAIREDNPELVEARRRGLPILHRSAALGALMLRRRGIAVAGTHGKTTTTAMIATVLDRAGLDPSFVIGGALTGAQTGGKLGQGEWLVVEADESDGSFLQYPAEIAVVTNVDPDHLVNWGTPENYRAGFLRFVTGDTVKLAVISADDPGAVELTAAAKELRPDLEVITFGADPAADVVFTQVQLAGTGSRFELHRRADGRGGPVSLDVPGDYNIKNAAATYAVTSRIAELADQEARVRTELASYGGTYRRFQPIGTAAGVRVFDDYAHHPTEVDATLKAARIGAGEGRVVACFQPHLYTRTRDFWREFGEVLQQADEVLVMDVCGDREDPIDGVTGQLVSDAIPAGTARVTYEPVWDAAADRVAELTRPGDLVVTIGCGDVTKVAPLIVQSLHRKDEAASVRSEGP